MTRTEVSIERKQFAEAEIERIDADKALHEARAEIDAISANALQQIPGNPLSADERNLDP